MIRENIPDDDLNIIPNSNSEDDVAKIREPNRPPLPIDEVSNDSSLSSDSARQTFLFVSCSPELVWWNLRTPKLAKTRY